MKSNHNKVNFIARNNRDKYFFKCWLKNSITPLVVNLHKFDKGSFTSPSLKESGEYESLIWSDLLLIMLDIFNWKRTQSQESGCGMVQHGCATLPGTEFAVPSSSGSLAWWQCQMCGLELKASAASCPPGSSISQHCLLHLVLLSSHYLLQGMPGKTELYFLILLWKWMFKCQEHL